MKLSFKNTQKPLMIVMVKHTRTPEEIKAEITRGLKVGAEGFGMQLEELPREYHSPEIIKEIFENAEGKPLYITNYKHHCNENLSYEEIGEELLNFIDYGATMVDVMGDMYSKHPEELTDNEEAVRKQMDLIDKIHQKGGEVIMSSHVNKYLTPERVLEIAKEHKRRGADISKIVAHGDTLEEQLENLKITLMLKEKLGIPYLFLSGGQSCLMHRRLGILLGCCMSLCVCEEIEGVTDNPQPLIWEQRAIRDELHMI